MFTNCKRPVRVFRNHRGRVRVDSSAHRYDIDEISFRFALVWLLHHVPSASNRQLLST
jgi:hypothetical protein